MTATRWARRGHDRLYVSGPDNERLGFRDLQTGEDHAESPLWRAVVAFVADNWSQDAVQSVSLPSGHALERRSPSTSQITIPTWNDLSTNEPGASLKAVLANKTGSEASSWVVGLEGEERVGAILAEVTRSWPIWQTFHSVPVGGEGADIDHVVMGPGGVFTLNTKHHPSASIYVNRNGFLVNGASTHHVRNARHEAGRAARLLSRAVGVPLHVTGLIVPVGARVVTVREQPQDLFVVPADDLHHWLRSTGNILPVEVLARIWEAARRSTTWQS